MLRIRQEQVDSFNAVMLERFLTETTAHVRELFPVETGDLEDEVLRRRIQESIARGATYGIVDRDPITLFIDLAFAHGRDFDEQKDSRWARDILRIDSLAQMDKMRLIYTRLEERESNSTD